MPQNNNNLRLSQSTSALSRNSSTSETSKSSNGTHCPFCPEPAFLQKECRLYRKFEDALDAVGSFGRYQIYMCLLLLYSTIMWEGNFSVDFFNQIRPTWKCTDAGNHSIEVDRLDHKEMCQVWDTCQNMTVVKRFFHSTVEEWKLECSRHYAMFYVGLFRLVAMVIGSFAAGHIGDWVGRKRYLYMSQYCFCIAGVMSIAAKSWQAYAVMTAISSFFYAIVEITGLTLAFAYIILAPIGYLTGGWRMYLIMVNFLCSPLLLGYLVLHESPRWVIQKDDLQRASTILCEIGSNRWNHKGTTMDPQQLHTIPRAKFHPRFYHFGHLFASKQLALQTNILFLAGLTEAFTQHASQMDKHRLVVNPFAQFALNGAMNLWIPFLLIFVDLRFPKFGRRALFLISLGIMNGCYATSFILHFLPVNKHLEGCITALTLIADGTAKSAFVISIDQIAIESYPTVIRCVGMGSVTAVSHAGGLIMTLWTSIRPGSKNDQLTKYGISVTLGLVTWILAYFLQRETKGLNLKETLQECGVPSVRKKGLSGLRKSKTVSTIMPVMQRPPPRIMVNGFERDTNV